MLGQEVKAFYAGGIFGFIKGCHDHTLRIDHHHCRLLHAHRDDVVETIFCFSIILSPLTKKKEFSVSRTSP